MSAATMEAIADRAGVSKTTVYRWWPSRGTLALEGLLEVARDSVLMPEGMSVRDALCFQVLALIRTFTGSDAGPLMWALVSHSQSDPQLARQLRERWLAPRRAVVTGILLAGMEAGEIRPGLDADAIADQLLAPVYYRLIFRHGQLADRLADVVVDQLMVGLRAREEELAQYPPPDARGSAVG